MISANAKNLKLPKVCKQRWQMPTNHIYNNTHQSVHLQTK
jgi:hypothetical protein